MKKNVLFLSFLLLSALVFNAYGQALSGDKIIKASGGDYPTLGAAIAALNANGVSGTVRFLIDENLNELGTALLINRNDLTSANQLIIKPNVGKTPTITITSFPTSGSNNGQGFTLLKTSFVTIDGSNSANGTTRDLTIIGNDAAGLYLLGVTDNCDDVTIKNLSLQITAMAAGSTGIGCDGVSGAGVADRLVIENCLIGSPTSAFRTGIGLFGNSSATPINAYAYNNEIYAKRRGITTYYNIKNIYKGNTIQIVTPDANQTFYAGIYLTGFPINDTSIIANNKITKLSSNPTGTVRFAGGVVIYGNEGVFNIYNNFIASNYTNASTSTTEKVYGIVFGSAGWSGTANIYYNTIDLSATNQTGRQACIGWELASNAKLNLLNNIMVNRNNTAATIGIHWPNTASATSILTSNYNNVVLTGPTALFGVYGATNYATLAEWITGTTLDLNTKQKAVFFVSSTDLHLTGSSLGDNDLKGTPVTGFNTDIDGQVRNATAPYKGADEYVGGAVPVELVSFTCNSNGRQNILTWLTASEANNYGFEIEKREAGTWQLIGFIKGSGTSTSSNRYSFTDDKALEGKVYYRLKQIDFNGSFKYSAEIEVNNSTPENFELMQNYPNPFNPSTVIRYSIPSSAQVNLTVFNSIGQVVASFSEGVKEAGNYNVTFNGKALSSGIYYCTINAVPVNNSKSFSATRKMLLVK